MEGGFFYQCGGTFDDLNNKKLKAPQNFEKMAILYGWRISFYKCLRTLLTILTSYILCHNLTAISKRVCSQFCQILSFELIHHKRCFIKKNGNQSVKILGLWSKITGRKYGIKFEIILQLDSISFSSLCRGQLSFPWLITISPRSLTTNYRNNATSCCSLSNHCTRYITLLRHPRDMQLTSSRTKCIKVIANRDWSWIT